jgi:hypothetical protein
VVFRRENLKHEQTALVSSRRPRTRLSREHALIDMSAADWFAPVTASGHDRTNAARNDRRLHETVMQAASA